MVKPLQNVQSEKNDRTVTVEKIIPIDTSSSLDVKASFPSLISFRIDGAPTDLSKAKLNLRKRRRHTQSDDNDTDADDRDDTEPELFAETGGGRVWHAKVGFHELFNQHFIGIRSKSTGKMRLVQVGAMYGLRPHISQIGGGLWDEIDKREETNVEEGGRSNEKSYLDKRNQLLDAFGGRRAILRVAKYERNRITEDKIDDQAAIHINQAGQEMVEKDADLGIHHNVVDTTESSAPPHNSDATTPEDAYPLLGLVSPQEMTALDDAVSLLIENNQEHVEGSPINPGWHPLVWDVISSILTSTSDYSDALKMRMSCAMHLHYLITLNKSKRSILPKVRQELRENMAVSDVVLSLILQRFTVSQVAHGHRQVRVKSPDSSAQIVKHAIIMWLYAHGFKNCGKLDELAHALNLRFKTVISLAVSIGCKVRKSKDAQGPQAYQVSLKTPLVFPPIRRKKSRSQKG